MSQNRATTENVTNPSVFCSNKSEVRCDEFARFITSGNNIPQKTLVKVYPNSRKYSGKFELH